MVRRHVLLDVISDFLGERVRGLVKPLSMLAQLLGAPTHISGCRTADAGRRIRVLVDDGHPPTRARGYCLKRFLAKR